MRCTTELCLSPFFWGWELYGEGEITLIYGVTRANWLYPVEDWRANLAAEKKLSHREGLWPFFPTRQRHAHEFHTKEVPILHGIFEKMKKVVMGTLSLHFSEVAMSGFKDLSGDCVRLDPQATFRYKRE